MAGGAQPRAHDQGRARLGARPGEARPRPSAAGGVRRGGHGRGSACRRGCGRGPARRGGARLGLIMPGRATAGMAHGIAAGRVRGQGRGHAGRRGGRRGKGKREGDGGSPWGLKSSDNRPPDHLGQGGGREVEERERELLRGKPNERERVGVHGGCGGARGARERAGPGWAGLGRVVGRDGSPQHA